ncbi:MAG: thioredoxin family protein, partial [Alphaproteobacteria bacterium]|nr:thioredoxin family protein [Alphaproteobacteria bacterium]
AALGLGMALPFLAVAAVPRAVTMLPKPGAWMATLKRAMALALIATAIWLLTVLAVQVSSGAAWVVGGCMALVLAALVIKPYTGVRWARAVPSMLVILAVTAYLAPGAVPVDQDSEQTEQQGAIAWVPFDRMAIPDLVAAGNVVFVDVTAEWCITCLVNKRRVLGRGEVARILGAGKVVTMKADWTQPDNDIAAYLASFNRFGIPFNAVYGPKAPRGITLPELLTSGAVVAALAQAGATVEIAEAAAQIGGEIAGESAE